MTRLGDRYRVSAGYDTLDTVEKTTAPGDHMWVLMTTYGLSDEEAAVAIEGVDQLLDRSHLLSVTPIACYLCEQRYERVVGKRCQGRPSYYAPSGEPIWVT